MNCCAEVCMYWKTMACIARGMTCSLRHPLGVLEQILCRWGGSLTRLYNSAWSVNYFTRGAMPAATSVSCHSIIQLLSNWFVKHWLHNFINSKLWTDCIMSMWWLGFISSTLHCRAIQSSERWLASIPFTGWSPRPQLCRPLWQEELATNYMKWFYVVRRACLPTKEVWFTVRHLQIKH